MSLQVFLPICLLIFFVVKKPGESVFSVIPFLLVGPKHVVVCD